jgi:predicted porin
VVTIFAGYEHVNFANPSNPYDVGQTIIGGYVLAYVNNTAYDINKVLQVYWAGAKWTVIPQFDLIFDYNGYHQNSYGTGKNAGCTTDVASTCSGTENTISLVGVYRFSKRFDGYLGTMYSTVSDGLASGFLNTNTLATTIGIRFKF